MSERILPLGIREVEQALASIRSSFYLPKTGPALAIIALNNLKERVVIDLSKHGDYRTRKILNAILDFKLG